MIICDVLLNLLFVVEISKNIASSYMNIAMELSPRKVVAKKCENLRNNNYDEL